MTHRFHMGILSLIVLLIPLAAVPAQAQSEQVTVHFHCFTTEELQHHAGLTATNHTNQDVQVVISTIDQNGNPFPVGTGVGATYIAPGQTLNLPNILPFSAPYNGWLVQVGFPNVEDPWNYPHEWLFEQTYTEGECSVNNGGVDPQPSPPAPTPTQTPAPTPTPMPNSFNLVSAQRMCADQQFQATWSGANIVSLEFALSNTSDEWTSGWIPVDPAAGIVTHAVDHHGYDKAVFRAVFEDETSDTVDADVGTCAEAPAPPPPAPPATSGGRTQQVTSLPSTGVGDQTNAIVIVAASMIALLASVLMVTGTLRKRI